MKLTAVKVTADFPHKDAVHYFIGPSEQDIRKEIEKGFGPIVPRMIEKITYRGLVVYLARYEGQGLIHKGRRAVEKGETNAFLIQNSATFANFKPEEFYKKEKK